MKCRSSHGFMAYWLECILENMGNPIFTRFMPNTTEYSTVETLEMIEGDLPQRAKHLVREWAEQYRLELLGMWKTQQYKQLPGLE